MMVPAHQSTTPMLQS